MPTTRRARGSSSAPAPTGWPGGRPGFVSLRPTDVPGPEPESAFEDGVERVVLRADRRVVGDTVGYEEPEATVADGGERFHVEGEDSLRE